MKYLSLFLLLAATRLQAQELYRVPAGVQSRWSSFENPAAAKGKGGMENRQAKGRACEQVKPGENKVLLNASGAGTIHRIWLTVNKRSSEVLRSIRLDMYWDGASQPAVSAPLGDFFGVGLGRRVAFENALFADAEGRSFNCFIPMPFRKGARVVLTNESKEEVTLFYDINFTQVARQPDDALYFHAHWSRNNHTKLGEDFEILPPVKGRGRFLGSNFGIITDTVYGKSWWGEGEVKVYLDGDSRYPTLTGTGTEDYIGTAWGQGVFINQYTGCTIADEASRQWTFYRFHIPDPIYFQTDCRVAIQQMGGDQTDAVRKMQANGARLIPVTVTPADLITVKLLEMQPVPKLTDPDFPKGWTNFYRLDNYSATAYFYLDKPVNQLAPLASVQERIEGLTKK
jgi:hypothetical protein